VVMTTNRRLVASAFVAAAVAVPLYAAMTTDTAPEITAGPPCLAWYGNIEEGKCLSYSNGNGINVGTPEIGVYGPDSGSMPGGGVGVITGPLLPGQTWQWNGGIG
jgi:hypothetical protein